MRTAAQLLRILTAKQVRVWVEDGRLRVKAPAGVLNDALRDELSAHKSGLMALLGETETLPELTVQPEQRYEPFPLTDVQHAYWVGRSDLFALGNIGTHSYTEHTATDLDLTRLNRAWQHLIDRHDALRMVIDADGQQRILAEVPAYHMQIDDLRTEPPAAQEVALQATREAMSHHVFTTTEWPLFDIRVSRLDEQRIRLHVSIDLLLVDAYSAHLLFAEWRANYQHPDRPVAPLTLSYRDYILAEQQLEASQLYENARAYWLERLPHLPPAPALPLQCQLHDIQKPTFERHTWQLNATSWQQLKQITQAHHLSPSEVILTAFALVLGAWSRQRHFTLNLTLFNRLPLHPQVMALIGDFTNLNLLEINLTQGEGSFVALGQAIRTQLLRDLDQRYFGGVRVLREMTRQQPGTPAIMPVVFTSLLANEQDSGFALFGEPVYGISQTSQVWLDHQVWEEKGQLTFNWDLVAELFPDGMMTTMFHTYCTLLEQLATQSALWQKPTLTLLPAAQQAQREAVNATEQVLLQPGGPTLLHTLFLQQVAPCADRPAVITPQRTLTYAELADQAARVAAWLRQHQARPNTLVAVVMDKGWEQVVAVLGIQLAGAAYLPVDPALPTARQHYLLAQGEVQTILTRSALDDTLDWPHSDIARLCVDNLPNAADAFEPEQYVCLNKPTDIAYVIYTSGSTGQPKGVVTDHRGAVNTILDINQRLKVTKEDRVLGLSALNFDLSVYDIFGLLAVGGAVVLPEAERRTDPAHWCDLIERHQVTVWNTVPALMQMLVDYQQDTTAAGALQRVMMSGDRIPLQLPERIRALYPQAAIYSLGGATEASIWSICYPIEQTDPAWRSIPYGKPLANQTFQVLDDQLQPRPVWVPGDLYIGGIGLAQGYWRDQARTAAQFITHPGTGERLYKTGDLGRYLPDGNIEFIGREDFQVKIRGHRIELGEIETALRQHATVQDVVVRAVGDTAQTSQQLVAYVVRQTTDQSVAFKLSQPGVKTCAADTLIAMPRPTWDDALRQTYLARQSYRRFSTDTITLTPFSHLLSSLCQMVSDEAPLPKYRYPSAGSLYPVQTYLYIRSEQVQGLAAGYYYYHPAEHKLAPCEPADTPSPRVAAINQPILAQAAFVIFLVAELAAIEPLYHDQAHDFCLLEAGYMSQLLMTQAPEHQIGLCPISGVHEDALAQALSLGDTHVLIHSLAGGQIEPEQITQWSQPDQGTTTSWQDQLHTLLQTTLPSYMVPTHYVALAELPLSANGKIDYQALPIPQPDDMTRADYIAPRTPTEQQIAAIWCEVLKCQTPGVNQDLFELGGDSLQATQILARLRQVFPAELTLRTLFTQPTIAELARIIDTQLVADIDPALLQSMMAKT